ncbi:MAG: PilZ domain-containing protein [Planctomycetales bacterium]
MSDPWSRPTIKDLHDVLESIEDSGQENHRSAERLDLCVPAEITTQRGNVIAAMTREISRHGMGLLHRGAVQPCEVRVKMASETREFEYRLLVEWCYPCGNGMFMSGGRFLGKADEAE